MESQLATAQGKYQDAEDKATQLESVLLSKLPQSDDTESETYRRQIDELQKALRNASKQYDEVSRQASKLKTSLQTLDGERDALVNEADEQTETISELETMLKENEATITDLHTQIQSGATHTTQAAASLVEREEQIIRLQNQMSALTRERENIAGKAKELEEYSVSTNIPPLIHTSTLIFQCVAVIDLNAEMQKRMRVYS